MIFTKDKSVHLKVLSSDLLYIFNTLFNLNETKLSIYPTDWVITSINDGKHLENSKHYKDQAIDLRSKSFSNPLDFKELLEVHLGERFAVLLENHKEVNEHFHIQVKRNSEV